MNFEWHDKKNTLNVKKHKISFNEAFLAFYDPFALIEVSQNSYEGRLTIIGSVEKGIIFVVYLRNDNLAIKLISARTARRTERKIYEAQWKNL